MKQTQNYEESTKPIQTLKQKTVWDCNIMFSVIFFTTTYTYIPFFLKLLHNCIGLHGCSAAYVPAPSSSLVRYANCLFGHQGRYTNRPPIVHRQCASWQVWLCLRHFSGPHTRTAISPIRVSVCLPVECKNPLNHRPLSGITLSKIIELNFVV